MAQHDFNIANQTFPNFRSDLNDALEAAATISAGSSAPSTTYAYQLWFDTSSNTYKIRDSANSAWIDFAGIDGSGNISFDTNTLYVDSTNNRIGINNTSPQADIDIGGSSGNNLRFSGSGTSTGGIEFYTSTAEVANIGVLGGSGTIDIKADPNNTESNSRIDFEVDGSEVARIDASGLSFDGGSNHLDFYEEGTWSLTPQTSSGTNASIGTSTGIYTRVGRLVTLIGIATNITKGNDDAGQFRIAGLPFTPVNENSTGSAFWDSVAIQGTNRYYFAPRAVQAGYIQFSHCGDDVADTALDHGDLDAAGTSDIQFTLTYMV